MDSAAPKGSALVVQVNAAPPPQPQRELRLEAWTSAATDTLDAIKTPLIIYASVSEYGIS